MAVPNTNIDDRIGDRWTALIVGCWRTVRGVSGRSRDAMGISPKVLSQTLRALERHGVVTRRASPEMPPRVEYALTPLGETLREPLAPVRDWAQIHVHDILAARERADAESSI